MNLKRREFLVLVGLSALGITEFSQIVESKPVPGVPVKSFRNAIASETPPALRFVSLADTGTGARGQYEIAAAMTYYREQFPFDLAILAGDNIYNRGEIEKIEAVFERPYQPLLSQGVKFHACLGNHDIATDNGQAQVNYANFNMQGRYYTFTRSLVQFFALDTNQNADFAAQHQWLEQELSRSQAPWKVVFGHHPLFSSGLHGGSSRLVRLFQPLFQRYHVQLYLNGHDHNYERTISMDGTTYLTCGAGARSRPVGRSSWTAYSSSRRSFAAFEVYPDRMVVCGIDARNRVFDREVIPFVS